MEKQNAVPGGIGLVLFALAMGGFAIGTTEFATMSLLPFFAPDLRIAIDPDDVLPVRHPRLALARRRGFGNYSYQRSAPSVPVVAICSPPWRFGS